MKSKILLAVFILFIFSLPSFSKVTGITLCTFSKNNKVNIISAENSATFIEMIENPETNNLWKNCKYVAGLLNYWQHYETHKGEYARVKKQLPKYATRQDRSLKENYAQRIISRTGEITAFMQSKPDAYNTKIVGFKDYFHILTEINNSLCEVTGSCNGGSYTLNTKGNVVFVSNDNKQPQKGTTPEEVVAEAAKKVQEMGGSGDGMGTGHGSGKGGFSWSSIQYFR